MSYNPPGRVIPTCRYPQNAVAPLVYIICALSGGHFFLTTKTIALSFIKISQQEESPEKKSGKGQVPGRDRGGKETIFHPWLMMICPQSAKAHCVEQTQRGHTCSRMSVNNSPSLLWTITKSHTPQHSEFVHRLTEKVLQLRGHRDQTASCQWTELLSPCGASRLM